MAKTRGTGLLMAWMDIDPLHEDAFNRWYDEEHIGRLLAVPGFLSAGSLCGAARRPKYLAMYELEDHNVLRSAAFLDTVRYQPSAERTRASGGYVGRNYLLNGYRQIFPARTDPIESTMGPRRSCRWAASTSPPRWRRSSTTGTTPPISRGYLTVPGCIRARRYLAVEGQPKYLTVYEFENAGVPDTPEWARARTGNPWSARMRPHVRLDEGSPAVFRRIHPQ